MRKEELKDWTRNRLKDEIVRLDKENADLQNSHMKLYNDTKDEIRSLKCEKERLMEENKAIKQRIKDLEDVCDGSCFSDEVDERNNLISNLQDQHQQDCIRINDLTTTIHVLSGLYSTLRKTVGMD
ncbi:MAG: hypothetical protein DBX97_04265 [Collinsella tanakaei]|nr:MAG: hypothetical protein DBX97_04265 [Collinsella tanakaei]